jgi:Spy/CpxP family protein refolding chaperone
MKRIFMFTAIMLAALCVNAQDMPEAQLAQKIAHRMADSLDLSNQQRAKLFAINMELSKKKSAARKNSSDRAAVGRELQRIEGARDDMYKNVLTTEQHVLYLAKKRSLVHNNQTPGQ